MANKTNISLPGTSGSRTVSVHTEREVIQFAVNESELEELSYLNAASAVFFSIGSFFLNDVWSGFKVYAANMPANTFFYKEILFVAAFYLCGLLAVLRRRGTIGRIKRDSKTIQTAKPKTRQR